MSDNTPEEVAENQRIEDNYFERREPDVQPNEVIEREVDSADADSHNERMRIVGRTFRQRTEIIEVPAGFRTVRAVRNRRRVIE